MKHRVTKVIGIGFLVAALAVPAVVLAQGWRGGPMMGNQGWRGGQMMANQGMGPGSMMGYDKGYGTITPEQRTQLDQLDRRFYDETADLRKDLWNKSFELNTILNGPDPDLDKVKALNKEISDLRGKLNEKSLTHQLEARKVTPDSQFGGGYGRSYGHHMGGSMAGMMGSGMMGPGMMGGGYGRGMARGPGNCRY
jgi:Spy/CpxP family protein refolding chaperone